MRALPWVLGLATLALACTPKESGPALWAKACDRALETIDDKTPERVEECRESMAAHPPGIADDIARCLLAGPATRTQAEEKRDFDACIRPETQTYFDRVIAANEQLGTLGQALRAQHGPVDHGPDGRLRALEGVPAEQLLDPWGHPIIYSDVPGEAQLCIVGPDGKHGTADDICEQPFVYFQF